MKLDNRITSLVLFIAGAFVFVLALIPNVSALVPGIPGEYQALQIADAGLGILGIAIGAGLALGLAGLGASIGMGTASAAALGAITEKPETFGKSILYVVFIEAVAIYGFVIAFLLVGYIPALIGG
jgi:V/A-type H+-transporting ATPase subunit K